MSSHPKETSTDLRVLFAGKPSARSEALIAILEQHDYTVDPVDGLTDLLKIAPSDADVLVLDAGDQRGVRDLLLLEQCVSAGVEFPLVLISADGGFEHCSRAIELGVAEVVQGAFEPTQLVLAVEAAARPRGPKSTALKVDAEARHTATYEATQENTLLALTELSAFLERRGIAAAHIARIGGATGELLDNACRYAYPETESGTVSLEAVVHGANATITLRDEGCGFDADHAQLESISAALPVRGAASAATRGQDGLSRAALVSERFQVTSNKMGTEVELGFELTPVALADCEAPSAEDLMPGALRSLVETTTGADKAEQLPPSLSLLMRRLTGNASQSQTAIRG